MVKLYFDLIRKKLWEIENVPLIWKADVQKMLNENEEDTE